MSGLKGRIDRKTFIAGNVLAAGAFLFASGLIMIPLAILDLVINAKFFDEVVGILVYAVIFPGIMYFIYFSTLMIKRAHDFNWPGLLIVAALVALVILGKFLDFAFLNLVAFLIFGFFCIKPGDKTRNNFGAPIGKKFKTSNLKVTF